MLIVGQKNSIGEWDIVTRVDLFGTIAMLRRLPKEVRDLGMPLVSVNPVEPGQADASEVKQ